MGHKQKSTTFLPFTGSLPATHPRTSLLDGYSTATRRLLDGYSTATEDPTTNGIAENGGFLTPIPFPRLESCLECHVLAP